MRAAEAGDQATVEQFSPMARMAYAQLDSVDADARYHMAMLYLHTGGVPEAKAVVDTLLQKSPGHLFGYMLQGSIARFSQDDKGVARGPEELPRALRRGDQEGPAGVQRAPAGRGRFQGSGSGKLLRSAPRSSCILERHRGVLRGPDAQR